MHIYIYSSATSCYIKLDAANVTAISQNYIQLRIQRHSSPSPLFITAAVLFQESHRKSCVTQAVRLSGSTFPPSSIGNAYLRKTAVNMFQSATSPKMTELQCKTKKASFNLMASALIVLQVHSLILLTD